MVEILPQIWKHCMSMSKSPNYSPASVIISKIFVMRSHFQAKIKRHIMALFLEKINSSIFFHGYKKYLKMIKQSIKNILVCVFSLDNRGTHSKSLKRIFCALVRWPTFLFVLKDFEIRSYLYFPGVSTLGRKKIICLKSVVGQFIVVCL